MLLKITNQCGMGCSHCLDNAKANGSMMSEEVFQASLDFINKHHPKVVMLSGGEPTEHPLFMDFLTRLIKETESAIIVASNGDFLDNKEITEFLVNSKVFVQITHDKLFYPRKAKPYTGRQFEHEISLHDKFIYVDKLTEIIPMGRARSFEIESKYGPKCFNFLQIAASDLSAAIRVQEINKKFCNPSILFNGDIVFGESVTCRPYGNIVKDDAATISSNARKALDVLRDYDISPCESCDGCHGFEGIHPTFKKTYKELLRENLLKQK